MDEEVRLCQHQQHRRNFSWAREHDARTSRSKAWFELEIRPQVDAFSSKMGPRRAYRSWRAGEYGRAESTAPEAMGGAALLALIKESPGLELSAAAPNP